MSHYMPNSTVDWLRLQGEFNWYYDMEGILRLHSLLHAQYGEDPVDEIIPVEQELSLMMRTSGYEHRHDDALSRAAATYIENPAPATVNEVLMYLSTITINSDAIELIQDTDGGPIYFKVLEPILKKQEKGLRKLINKALPPGVQVKTLGRTADGSFAKTQTIYALKLTKRDYAEIKTSTWDVVTAHLRAAAAAASTVFKADQDPSVPFKVMKSDDSEEERLVTGQVLVPEVVDLTTKNADGSPTGAEGDIYDDVEIRKAMFWWAENAGRSFSYHHIGKGSVAGTSGMSLTEDDVQLLEIWQARSDYTEGETAITKGTWMMTARVHHDGLWEQIQKGEIQSWSIGAHAMGAMEEVSADKLPARS